MEGLRRTQARSQPVARPHPGPRGPGSRTRDAGSLRPHLTSFAAAFARLYVSHRKLGGGRSPPVRSLPERGAVTSGSMGCGLEALWMVGSTAASMLQATWRRAARAAAAAARPRFTAPTRGLRLRGTVPFRLGPVLPGCPNRLRCCCYTLHLCGACPLGYMSQTLNLPVACSHIFSVRPLPPAMSELGSHLSDLSRPTVKVEAPPALNLLRNLLFSLCFCYLERIPLRWIV